MTEENLVEKIKEQYMYCNPNCFSGEHPLTHILTLISEIRRLENKPEPVEMKYAKPILSIKHFGNYRDCLGHGNTYLKDGEKLRIRYPSGVTEDVTVDLDHTMVFGDEDYDRYDYGKAYANVFHEGISIRIPLVGLMAERIIND